MCEPKVNLTEITLFPARSIFVEGHERIAPHMTLMVWTAYAYVGRQ